MGHPPQREVTRLGRHLDTKSPEMPLTTVIFGDVFLQLKSSFGALTW